MADSLKQTKVNFYTNVFALISSILVGFYYTPYLLNSLGLAAYGVLPLALIINQYVSVATQTLTHAYTRFYSVALQKGDYAEASKDISTSLFVVLFISLLLFPIGVLVVLNVDRIFQIPLELVGSAQYLFIFTLLSLVVSLFSSLLNVTLYSLNRLDLMNYLKLIRIVFKFVLVILFFEFIKVDILFVGLTGLLIEVVILVVSICYFIRFKPSSVKISLFLFDKLTLYSILSMSIWVLIQLCGDTLLYRTDNLLVNHYWGIISSGALGAVSEIGNYVSVAVSVLGSLFGPLILIAFAKNNHNEVKSLFIEQSTIVGCISAIITGVLSGCGVQVLSIWLGNNMGDYNWWLTMKMLVLPFYASGGIMAFVYRSWNKMKFPAIGTIVLGFIDIVALIALCELFHPKNAMIVLVISAIFSVLQCFVLNAIAVCRIYPECSKNILVISWKIFLSFVASYAAGVVSTRITHIDNLLELAFLLVTVGSVMGISVFFFVLGKNERLKLINIIK